MEYGLFSDVFDLDLYDIVLENDDYIDTIKSFFHPDTGSVIAYDRNTKSFIDLSADYKELESYVVLGIVIKSDNETGTVDVLHRSMLTADPVLVPIKYISKALNNVYAYLKDLFDRFCNKYKRISKIDITDFQYNVPSIALLDYMLKNINVWSNALIKSIGTEKTQDFFRRLINVGVFSYHKGKYYCWKLNNDMNSRVIENLKGFRCYDLIPVMTLQYNI